MTREDTEELLRRAVDQLGGDDVSTWRGVRLLSHLEGDRDARRVLDEEPGLEQELMELLGEAATQSGRLGDMAEDVSRSLGGGRGGDGGEP